MKVNLKRVRKKIKMFRKDALSQVAVTLKKEIIQSIESGVSPVKGSGRFDKYSDSYRTQIKKGQIGNKKVSPVNLKVTGELLRSIFSKVSSKGVTIGFDNFLADIHNRRGAGKSKAIRRMLPTGKGEEFSRSITLRVNAALVGLKKRFFK